MATISPSDFTELHARLSLSLNETRHWQRVRDLLAAYATLFATRTDAHIDARLARRSSVLTSAPRELGAELVLRVNSATPYQPVLGWLVVTSDYVVAYVDAQVWNKDTAPVQQRDLTHPAVTVLARSERAAA